MAELRIGCGKPRAVRAPRGTELHCRGWHQEAARDRGVMIPMAPTDGRA